MKLTVDTVKISLLADALSAFNKKGLPFAAREALNKTAFVARAEWVDQMGKKLILRNKFTQNRTQVVKVSAGYDVNKMQSSVGTPLNYMKRQEDGGIKTAGSHEAVAIPTTTAAGMGLKSKPRKRAVRKANFLAPLMLQAAMNMHSGSNRRYRNMMAIQTAADKGGGIVYLETRGGKRKGLYEVTGTKRGLKATRDSLKVKMLWDLSRSSVKDKPKPTLEPTLKAIESKLPRIYIDALKQQLMRHFTGAKASGRK